CQSTAREVSKPAAITAARSATSHATYMRVFVVLDIEKSAPVVLNGTCGVVLKVPGRFPDQSAAQMPRWRAFQSTRLEAGLSTRGDSPRCERNVSGWTRSSPAVPTACSKAPRDSDRNPAAAALAPSPATRNAPRALVSATSEPPSVRPSAGQTALKDSRAPIRRPWSRLGVRRCTALTTDAHCTPLPIPPRSAASTSTAGSQKCQSRIASPVVTSPSRSEERRVGKECRARGAPEHEKQKNKERRD